MKGFTRIMALAGGTALASLAFPAFAQDVGGQAVGAPTVTGGTATDAQGSAEGDIIVTANKREERLQDVPISVSVINGEQLTKQNIVEVTDLVRSTPALNSAGPFGALSIRGVGSLSFSRSSEGSVGVVVDGVALANTSTTPPQLFDVARVEVLEGPQGTLFGRNSSAGLVNVTTVAPNPDKWEVIAHADIATRENYIARGTINIPVASNAALRVSGAYSQPPQVHYNTFDDTYLQTKGKSVRGRFLWKPISELTINLIGDYGQFDRRGGTPWTVYQSSATSLLTQRLTQCGVVVAPENQVGCTDGGNFQRQRSYGFSGQVDAQIGAVTLTSISAYRAAKSRSFASDVDSVPVDRLNVNSSPINVRNFSQEFRLTSPTGGFVEYVAGLYYFDSKLDGVNTQRGFIFADLPLIGACPYGNSAGANALCRGLPVGQVQTTSSVTTSYAAFGNATLNVTPALRILLGARYGQEDVSARTTGVLVPGALTGILSIAPISGAVSDAYFSYRAGAQFDVNRDVMIYGTYTRGYKGPSINDQTGTGNIPKIVAPEIPHASEIGIKVNAFDRRLTASIAGFYNRVTNFQAQFFDPTASAFIFGNAPKLTTKGVSLNIIGRPVRALTLNLGAVYNDAKYGDGYFVACAQGQTAAQGCQSVLGPTGAVIGRVDNAGGNRLIGAPRWKVTGFAEYTANLGDRFDAFLQADVVYTSKVNFDAAFSPQNSNRKAAIVGGRIGVRTDDERYGVSVFARNVFDTFRPAVRFATPTAQQQLDPLSFSQISGPESRRTIGVSLDARF